MIFVTNNIISIKPLLRRTLVRFVLCSALIASFIFSSEKIEAQKNDLSKVWVADNGDGTYKNPIIHADYSDPDVIRVGNDFYMVASSFDAVPGLPILHSKDLVNWTIIGHALKKQIPFDHFSQTQHGNGVWAPAIRYHNNQFYIFYPDPDFGIYVITSQKINGEWTEPKLVEAGKGLIDPCPLWDDDGKVYLVHAFAGSRAGIKNILVIKQMNADATKTINAGKLVYDAHGIETTVEGPKLYKRNNYYYIFAPAGGVSTGYQIVLRSKNIYGPYERKIVLHQGSTNINGPHQGAWVTTQKNENWFIHFQDKAAYGRIIHLQPMTWKNDWPMIGVNIDKDGIGEPVAHYKKPDVGSIYEKITPVESDEFNNPELGLQWQWQANPQQNWAYIYQGSLRMYAQKIADSAKNYWDVPNVLLQKFPTEEFRVTTKIKFHPNLENEKIGFIVMGTDYAYVSLIKKKDGIYIGYSVCKNADKGNAELERIISKTESNEIYFSIEVKKNAICNFSYSTDNKNFISIGESFPAKSGKWIGAKFGFFCSRNIATNDAGYADIDWCRVSALENK
ncbi:Non-reducing end alpha-L-arabinofuranosidase BoGH43B precursor [mine drainage metagenome]|uniref:Non-reducing end alpha-L-arabinofuranosidase BoGH43B n=1 Tax=mine drainage metagenome TaxID=410659 RepID=A0A1J5RWD5_9ZZZZ